MSFDWHKLTIPTQTEYEDVEYVNPAEAYRKQVDAINLSAPVYAELETVDAWLARARRIEREVVRRVLAQEMNNIKGTQTRNSDMVDAFVLASAEFLEMEPGQPTKDARPFLLKIRRRIERLEARKETLERRLKAIQNMADWCDRILNWCKFEAKLSLSADGGRRY